MNLKNLVQVKLSRVTKHSFVTFHGARFETALIAEVYKKDMFILFLLLFKGINKDFNQDSWKILSGSLHFRLKLHFRLYTF